MESALDDQACVGALLPHLPEDSNFTELRTTVCHLKLFEPILSCGFKSYNFTSEDGDEGVDN